MGRKSNINESLVLELVSTLKNTTLVANKLNVKPAQVQWILKKYNFSLGTSVGHRKYQADHTFFNNIDTEEKAYWLGFMMADGSILEPKSKSNRVMKLIIQARDELHLYKFKEDLNSEHPVNKITLKSGKYKGNEYSSFGISSKELTDDLIRLGCTPRKSLTLKFPVIDDELIHHFIRGYFDGDGSVFTTVEKHWRSGALKEIILADFIGTFEFLTSLLEYLTPIIGSCVIKHNKRTSTNVYTMRFKREKKVLAFYKYLYRDATIFLERKKEKFDNYFR